MKKNIIIILICFLIFQFGFSNSFFRVKKKNITIYWDTSFSMRQKDIVKEMDFLDLFFKDLQNVNVELILFSSQFSEIQDYAIINSDWDLLKKRLQNINYDGVAHYDLLSIKNNSDFNLLFTDGIEVIDQLKLPIGTPTFVINSCKLSDRKLLKKQCLFTSGKFIDLNELYVKDGVLMFFDNGKLNLKKVISNVANIGSFSGKVYGVDAGLENVIIRNLNTNKYVITNGKGYFSIDASIGDILKISSNGKVTRNITIADFNEIDILLVDDENLLNVVELKGNTRKPEIINIGTRKMDKTKIGYSIKSVDASELSKSNTLSLHGKIPGISAYKQNDDISQMILRGRSFKGNVYPLVVIDGIPIPKSSSSGSVKITDIVNQNNIKNITVLSGLAATNKWGSEGGNGVVLITTITGSKQDHNVNHYNSALIKDNDYQDNLKIEKTHYNKKYFEGLKQEGTYAEFYNFYSVKRKEFENDFQFFLDISDYATRMGNIELSTKILSNIIEISPKSIVALRLVAFKSEEKEDFSFSKKVYQKILNLKPNEAQSYVDLARVYQQTEDVQQAFNIYSNIFNAKYKGIDFSGLDKIIKNDYKRLILQNKDVFVNEYSKIYPMKYDARIIIGWNDNSIDFELQFVNPSKKFFTWDHTKKNKISRIEQEMLNGIYSEEFLIEGGEKGEWLINIKSQKTKKNQPIAIKYTLYENFGKINETVKRKILILNNVNKKQMIGKILIQ